MPPPASQPLRLETPLPPVAAQLNSAFELFNELSEQLAETYRAMEQRVGELNRELHEVAEQRLRELQEKERFASRLQSLLALLPAGVVLIDRHGCVADSNPAARELLGLPLDGQRWRDIIARAFAPRSDDGHEISLRDGRRIAIATRSLDGEAGQLLLLTDLTETRELQQRLARHQRLSEMGRMVSSLAHQIRTPLSAAMLYASHLCERDLSAEQMRKFSRKVLERLTHLERQVRDMLIFVRGDVRLTDTFTAGELFDALQSAAETALASADAQCAWQCAASEAVVHGNREVLVSALMNLVNNALQAAGRGAQLHIGADRKGNELYITVRDNGPGFGPEVARHLNEPFFTSKTQGTGLGLAVVRAVADAHGGRFALTSTPGEGACAALWLPLFDAKVDLGGES
jgi:two-component system sensor histidine kinase FlrB